MRIVLTVWQVVRKNYIAYADSVWCRQSFVYYKKGHEFSTGGKLTKNTKDTRSTVFLMGKNQTVYSDLLESI